MRLSRYFGPFLALFISFASLLAIAEPITRTSPFEARAILQDRAVVAGTLCATVNVDVKVTVVTTVSPLLGVPGHRLICCWLRRA